MAYANNYMFMYGFSLLDDLHNFFPEILYDEALFPDQRFGWFRHRTSTLFPSVFPRQMNMYRIYNSAQRQAAFNTWVSSQTIGIQGGATPSTPATSVPVPVPAAIPAVSEPPVVPSASTTSFTPHNASTSNPSSQPRSSNFLNAGALIGVNTVGASLRNANWDLRSSPPNPTVQVSPWTTTTNQQRNNQSPLLSAPWVQTTNTVPPARTYSQVAASPATELSNAANVLLRMTQVAEAASEPVPTTPLRNITRTAPTAPVRRTTASALGSDVDILTALLTLPSLPSIPTQSVNTGLGNDLISLLTNNFQFQDVVVVPTMAHIDAGSTIVQHDEVPADENCAICQEHALHGGSQSPWRRLNCSHQFHTSCIMPWFQRNVHCPVCRADIRELGGHSQPSTDDAMSVSSQSSAEGGMEPQR